MNPYDVLGVTVGASEEDIRRSYRQLVLTHHPDKGGKQDDFSRVQAAWELLQDPQRRLRWESHTRSSAATVVPRARLQREAGVPYLACRCGDVVLIEDVERTVLGLHILLQCATCSLQYLLV
ncbi:MAG: hypothetical protein KVP17_003598 [Porospora cf. gigantea B]|uniref:uncharacterized protein n=1 Tax=Porospora cf. gigantea B TaxID=2853592 RepID=UPI003571B623|nr:MAG: hypothetical protein KVP17_003598 [Porospora cf. gigantea B]